MDNFIQALAKYREGLAFPFQLEDDRGQRWASDDSLASANIDLEQAEIYSH